MTKTFRDSVRWVNQLWIDDADDTEILYLFHQVKQEIDKRGLLKGRISK